jgi:glycosyltransferase involved in cell wall biosynthesis
MAAGVPVVAVRGPGGEDVVGDLQNGRIVDEKVYAFVDACLWYFHMNETQKHLIRRNAVSTAETYSKDICVKAATDEYLKLLEIKPKMKDVTAWQKLKESQPQSLNCAKYLQKHLESP